MKSFHSIKTKLIENNYIAIDEDYSLYIHLNLLSQMHSSDISLPNASNPTENREASTNGVFLRYLLANWKLGA